MLRAVDCQQLKWNALRGLVCVRRPYRTTPFLRCATGGPRGGDHEEFVRSPSDCEICLLCRRVVWVFRVSKFILFGSTCSHEQHLNLITFGSLLDTQVLFLINILDRHSTFPFNRHCTPNHCFLLLIHDFTSILTFLHVHCIGRTTHFFLTSFFVWTPFI